jgi:hypothetical protein
MERIRSSKRQVKPQKSPPSLSPTGAKPRLRRSETIAPQVHTRAIQKPLKSISSPRESLKSTIVLIVITTSMDRINDCINEN